MTSALKIKLRGRDALQRPTVYPDLGGLHRRLLRRAPEADVTTPAEPAPPEEPPRENAERGVWRAPEEPRPLPGETGRVRITPAKQYHHPLTGAEPVWHRASQPGQVRFAYTPTAPPDPAEEAVAERQLRLRAELWNTLVPIEHRRRAQLEELLYGTELRDEIAGVQNVLGELYAARKKAEEKSRFAPRIAETERKRVELFAEAQRVSAGRLALTARRAWLIQQQALVEIKAAASQAARQGLYWWTANDVMVAYRISRVQAALDHVELKPQAPLTAAAHLTVRWPGGIPVPALLAGDDRFHLEKNRAAMRIAGDPPVWLHFAIRGALPHAGRVRQVFAIRTPAKPRANWSLVVTLSERDSKGR
jgi:hypothetical protein